MRLDLTDSETLTLLKLENIKQRQTLRVKETNQTEVSFLLDRPETEGVSLSFERGRVFVSQILKTDQRKTFSRL